MQLVMSPYAAARATEEKPKERSGNPSATAASDVVLKTMQDGNYREPTAGTRE